MRILIDLQAAQSISRMGGIGRYSLSLTKAMLENDRGHDISVLLNGQMADAIPHIRWELRNLIPQNKIIVFDVPRNISGLSQNIQKRRIAELIREKLIADIQPDILHISSLFEGLADDSVTSIGDIFKASKTGVTLYDLIPLVDQERYLSNDTAKAHYLNKLQYIIRSGYLLSISDYSRDEVIQLLGYSKDKVVNISSAADHRFMPMAISQDKRAELLSRYSINRDFMMYTASFDTRKNHEALIIAYTRLSEELRSKYQLVIVGNGNSNIYECLWAICRKLGINPDSVVFPGFVPDDDLVLLYNSCSLFVFPSLMEGFGLPILEAMSCGVPAIGSNTTCIPEVIGTKLALFDPTNIDDIANMITHVLSDKNFYSRLHEHALNHSRSFSWKKSASTALDFLLDYHSQQIVKIVDYGNQHMSRHNNDNYDRFLRQVSQEGTYPLDEDDYIKLARAVEINETIAELLYADCNNAVGTKERKNTHDRFNVNIGWISTWNTKCGIAEYSKFLVGAMPVTPTIFASSALELIQADGSNVVRCWDQENDTLDRLSGEIDKHSINCLVIQFNYNFFNFSKLSNFIFKQVGNGRSMFFVFHSTNDPENVDGKSLSDLVDCLKVCTKIFVHTRRDIENLKRKGITGNVDIFPHGVSSLAIEDDKYSGNNLPTKPNNKFTIASYGFSLPHKGFLELIQAVDILVNNGADISLIMVNAEYPASVSSEIIKECKEAIKNSKINDRINLITDYLSESDALNYLRSANLVVFPYQNTGESSSAAVRIGLASKRPVAVTPLPIFDDVSDVVFKLPGITPEKIAVGIREIIAKLRTNNNEAIAINSNAERWRRSHVFNNLAIHLYNETVLSTPRP